MGLPVPNLDDRRFQELVDEAKRRLQQRCGDWTDHNVHDPGVTLIELFAWMTEQLIYRLNRVPTHNYVRFLELLGVKLFPPTAAKAPVTFWLAAPQPETVRIPAGTRAATVRTETDDAIVFSTVESLDIRPCSFLTAMSVPEEGPPRHHRDALDRGEGFACFSPRPVPGDSLLVGLSEGVPSCAVTLRFSCRIEGFGVDPRRPPRVWEAWNGEQWLPCEIERDETGGFNRDGDVVLHVPRGHSTSVLELERAGWLRAKVTRAGANQPAYDSSPLITAISAFTSGGTADAVNADTVEDEVLGSSEGVPGQVFTVKHRPVVPGEPLVLEVSSETGWEEWEEQRDFSRSGPEARHFTFDSVAGELRLGPAVREQDGSLRSYGATPREGAQLRLRAYRTGGGFRGNVARGAIRVLKSSIPYVSTVVNRRPATGGVDGEDIENAKLRGPIVLRTLGRAVTAEDYEQLAREAAPEVMRVRCVAASDGPGAGGVRVLVVPAVRTSGGELTLEQLKPAQETVEKIGRRLDECRLIGTRPLVEPPHYRWLTVVARLRSRQRVNPPQLQKAVLEALYTYFNPVLGGPGRDGWPFGRMIIAGEVYALLQALPGTELVEDVQLFEADPQTGQRGADPIPHLALEPHELVFSYRHKVLVE
ncbi:MAG: putative baseplate assembly protein [Candidatus Nephthysia bennettiae]|uniref:Baseplate assembly protein n=1 Tax=Candidatus Nephthysia bennettiae TaxID=3127016 RepID=A0A934JZN8_9BACT|nr:putative baseplate assembly protein [Candidatus Dormibacteraeota bacterium]MBJ7614805.1 putative baseplate assembly protein [Candidatus Dormibacteraeota bacterium]PZR93104.1 MAG: putative baseplate assembly protein [Candidatus Dormibacteraeota bacterium]